MKTEHKKTCAHCGWPRSSEVHHGVVCESHCAGCRQGIHPGDTCIWCCHNCHAFPCKCQQIAQEQYSEEMQGATSCGDPDCSNEECQTVENGKVVPPGKVYTGYGKSGYATDQLNPAWEAAGIIKFPYDQALSLYADAQEAWPDMRCDVVDPVQRAADFYLLSAITSGVLNSGEGEFGEHISTGSSGTKLSLRQVLDWHPELTGAMRDAQTMLDELVDDTDKSFVQYIDMACGGELRHHPRVGGKHLSGTRSRAWVAWRALRDIRGVEALMDAYWLFNDFTSQGYGGPLWAGAAQLLYRRLTHQLPKTTFVDQTFSLVHNGGVFLNKQHWNSDCGKDLTYLQKKLLPAQSRDNWPVMLEVASADTRSLWSESWRDLNRARLKANLRPTKIPTMNGNKVPYCGHCGMDPRIGHRDWACKDGQHIRRIDKDSVSKGSYGYKYPAWTDGGKVLNLYGGLFYGCYTSVAVRIARNWGDVIDALLTEEHDWRHLSRLTFNDRIIWEFILPGQAVMKWNLQDLLDLHGIRVVLHPSPLTIGEVVKVVNEGDYDPDYTDYDDDDYDED